MSKKYLFCTRLRIYLIELPLVILFAITLYFNQYSDGLLKFYPLLVFLALSMIYIFIYFFRAISISFDEIRYLGLFSSRDHAEINEGKELIFTLLPKKKMKVELFGNDGRPPELSWILEDESYKPVDIYLFRGKAIGKKRQIGSILRYFGVEKADIDEIFSKESFSGDYEYVSLKSEIKEDITTVRLTMKQTV